MEDDLRSLRESIAEVDRELLELLGQRMDLAARVGRVKAATGMEVVARDVEDRILGRARDKAKAAGISEGAMEGIFREILRASVERQHRVGMEERVRRGGRVLVIGGAGGMGTWLGQFLGLVGHRVDAVDPAWKDAAGSGERPRAGDRWASLDDVPDLAPYEAVILSVPLAAVPGVLDAISARRPPGLVVEIASIQSHLEPALRRAEDAGVRVCALHPMFGPATPVYQPLTFVLACRRPPAEEEAAVDALLRHPYTRLVSIPFAHHDRLMGWLLGLAHLGGMLFGAALAESGLEARELQACASTTFTRQAATARSVLLEDPELYFDIQRLNPHRVAVYAAVRAALDRLVTCIDDEDLVRFRTVLAEAREAVGEEEGAR